MLLYLAACNTHHLLLWAVKNEKKPQKAWLDRTQNFVFLTELMFITIICFAKTQLGHRDEGVCAHT